MRRNPASVPETQADIKIASALLFLRDSVSRPDDIDASWPQSLESHLAELGALADPDSGDSERALRVRKIAEVEYQHARSAIAAQLREVLGGLEKLLTASPDAALAAGFDSSALKEASIAVGQVASVLEVAGSAPAADVATELAGSLAAFGGIEVAPEGDNLEHMAFAVAALGVAADHLSRRGPEADNVLHAALDRLHQVVPPESHEADVESFADDDSSDAADLEVEHEASTAEVSAGLHDEQAEPLDSELDQPGFPGRRMLLPY